MQSKMTLQSKQEALVVRNQQDKQLFDVVIIDHEFPELSQIILQKIDFELASLYVQDYNSSIDFHN